MTHKLNKVLNIIVFVGLIVGVVLLRRFSYIDDDMAIVFIGALVLWSGMFFD